MAGSKSKGKTTKPKTRAGSGTSPAADGPIQPVRLKDLEKSRFYAQLKACETTGDYPGANQLRLDVEQVVAAAQSIADQVVRFLPQYTDHARQHLFNVLSFMEHLAGDENIQKMGPLECALGILAALTHDLGMALAGEELEKIDIADRTPADGAGDKDLAAVAWRNFRDSHSLMDRVRSQRALAEAANRKLDADEGRWETAQLAQIRADYIRQSHADDRVAGGYNRIHAWLKNIITSHELHSRYRGFNFWESLSWLGMSHGQSIYWLAERLEKGANGFSVPQSGCRHHRLGANEKVDWCFLSWLLRLADIMDFDQSRTPLVIFDHAGIKDPKSRLEWLKHRSLPDLPSFETEHGRPVLKYFCPSCPAPEVEKAIRQTLGWIDQELAKVELAQSQHPSDRLRLHLPDRTVLPPPTEREGGYLYRDVEFRLDRDAVMDLLMGEALYGKPTLALRELVQNSLDALHLRDLRVKLLGKLGKPESLPQSVDLLLPNEELAVKVTWGTEDTGPRTGQRYIRVVDNGVGMTLDVIQRFLTQIGRSYYKSDVYRREAELMRRHGLVCTTISQFGIGFLSSFMLADHVTLRTRACGASPHDRPLPGDTEEQSARRRFPLRAEINGTHGLIAFYPDDSVSTCGTEVTLWLKKEFDFAPWDRERTVEKLAYAFYEKGRYSSLNHEFKVAALEPAFEVASRLVWPLFPIKLGSATELVVDDLFHPRELIPIDQEAFADKVREWEGPEPQAGQQPGWCCCDWTHPETGSRIRLMVSRIGPAVQRVNIATLAEWPNEGGQTEAQLQTDLHSYLEPQLPDGRGRHQRLVNGVAVPDLKSIGEQNRLSSGVGSLLWLDWRGLAAPRLKADRTAATTVQPETQAAWQEAVQAGWVQAFKTPRASWRWMRLACRWNAAWQPEPFLVAASEKHWQLQGGHVGALRLGLAVLQESCLARDLARDRDRDRDRDLARVFARDHDRDRDRDLDRALDLDLALARALALDRALDLDLDLALARALARHLESLKEGTATQMYLAWQRTVQTHLLSEALWPNLGRAYPSLAVSGSQAKLGEWHLEGPLQLCEAVVQVPDWAAAYDLFAPLTGVAVGPLRSACSAWAQERWMRPLYTLPFLLGQEVWGNSGGSRAYLRQKLGQDSLFLFIPGTDLWSSKFGDHEEATWSATGASALWDLTTGEVVYANGLHTRESIRKVGKPLKTWLGMEEKK